MLNKNLIARIAAAMAVVGFAAVPLSANAQSARDRHHQEDRNIRIHQAEAARARTRQADLAQAARLRSIQLQHAREAQANRDRAIRARQSQNASIARTQAIRERQARDAQIARAHSVAARQAELARQRRIQAERSQNHSWSPDARNRAIHDRQARERAIANERLRIKRNEALERARRAHSYGNQRPLVIHNTYTTYRPEVIYRTPPTIRYKYVYVNDQPRWYPAPPPNEWFSIANISGGSSLLQLLQNDDRLIFPGSQGALYSYDDYEADRYSRLPERRLRYTYFSRPFIYRNGCRYDRITVKHHGHRYYRFVRR